MSLRARAAISLSIVLLRGALGVRFRLRDRQQFDRRPQLIDQRIAVANSPSLCGTGQSVPQRQQPLGAKRGSVQLLIRGDGNLAVIECRRRLAAQRDPVIADNVNAHGWVILIDPAAAAAGDPTHALFAEQSQSFSDNAMALFGRISSTELLGRARGLGSRISMS